MLLPRERSDLPNEQENGCKIADCQLKTLTESEREGLTFGYSHQSVENLLVLVILELFLSLLQTCRTILRTRWSSTFGAVRSQ